MKSNNRKRFNLYTQHLAARVVLIVGVLFGCCRESVLATSAVERAQQTIECKSQYLRQEFENDISDLENQRIITAYTELGEAYLVLKQWEDAIHSFLAAQNRGASGYTQVLNNRLATAWGALRDTKQAERCAGQASFTPLGVSTRTPSNYPVSNSTLDRTSTKNVAANTQSSSKPAKSLEELQKALGEAKKRYKVENNPDVVKALSDVGNAHKYLGQQEEALKHYQQALQMQEVIQVQASSYRLLIALRLQVAQLLVEVANKYYDSNPEKAIKNYQEALKKNVFTCAQTKEIEKKLQDLCQEAK